MRFPSHNQQRNQQANQVGQAGQLSPVITQVIDSTNKPFEKSPLVFDQEKVFVFDILDKNPYMQTVAFQNPKSLEVALYNLASVGLSLNPVTKLAYLVPRRFTEKRGNQKQKVSRVVLDISYQGLIEIAVQAQVIKSCSVTLLYQKDLEKFEWVDNFNPPRNPPNPFVDKKERGELMGGYCQARMMDGSFMLFPMMISDVYKRRDASEMIKSNGISGPWKDWEEEMVMKTIVKAASKWWPTNGNTRLAEAMRVLNEDAGEGLPDEDVIDVKAKEVTRLPPPDESELPEKLVAYVNKIVDRAAQSSAWAACEDHFTQKFKTQEQLPYQAYALDVLKQRKEQVQTQQ